MVKVFLMIYFENKIEKIITSFKERVSEIKPGLRAVAVAKDTFEEWRPRQELNL